MKNPFSVTSFSGYRWWTCGGAFQTRDEWGYLKLGPVSFAWGDYSAEPPEHWHFEVTVFCRWWWRCNACRLGCTRTNWFGKVKA